MGALLAKLATQLLMPLPLSLGLAAVAVALVAWGRRRSALACLATSVLLLWVASMHPVALALLGSLERVHPPMPLAEIAPAEAILLLGGATAPGLPPRQGTELESSADRVLHAARLYRAGKAPLVISSGGGVEIPDADGMAELLIEWGVPDAAIVRETRSLNTHDNCVESREILRARGDGPVLIVTSASHMPRALATCRTAGLDARPAPTDFQVAGESGLGLWGLLPDAGALALTQRALKEIFGHRVYAWRGWIQPE